MAKKAKRRKRGDQIEHYELWKQWVEGGRKIDSPIREQLIEIYLPRVKHIVRRLAGCHFHGIFHPDELLGAGFEGLANAIDTFDPERRLDFWTPAHKRVSGAVLDYARQVDQVGRVARKRATKRRAAIAAFAGENGREPTRQEIAELLGWTEEEVDKNVLAENFANANTPIEDRRGDKTLEFLEVVAIIEDKPSPLMKLSSFLTLTGSVDFETRVAMYLYFFKDNTMQAIAGVLGKGESRVSQVIKNGCKRIAAHRSRDEWMELLK